MKTEVVDININKEWERDGCYLEKEKFICSDCRWKKQYTECRIDKQIKKGNRVRIRNLF